MNIQGGYHHALGKDSHEYYNEIQTAEFDKLAEWFLDVLRVHAIRHRFRLEKPHGNTCEQDHGYGIEKQCTSERFELLTDKCKGGIHYITKFAFFFKINEWLVHRLNIFL